MYNEMHQISTSSAKIILFFIIILNIELCFSQDYYEEISYPDTINVFTMLPLNHDTIIVGYVSDNPWAYAGVIRTFDGGDSWEAAGLNNHRSYCFIIGEGDTIYTGTSQGIFRTGDFGNNWEQVLTFSQNMVSLVRLQSGIILSGFWGGIMRSLDNGATWDTSFVRNQNTVINALLAVSDSEIYAGGIAYTSDDGGIFKSENLGDSWEYMGLNGYSIQAFGYIAPNELFIGCFYSGLIKTINSGASWETVLPNKDVRTISVNDNQEIYVGCEMQNFPEGGIFYSPDDGNNWEDRTYNISNKNVKMIHITPDQYLYSLSRYESIVLGPPFNRSISPVSVNEAKSEETSKIVLYPNPVSGLLYINVQNEIPGEDKIKIFIYDSNGHLLYIDSMTCSGTEFSDHIPVSQLNKGSYYIKLVIGKNKYLKRILIL